MKCFDICGDDGNVTIIESTGPSMYEVEAIKGFPIGMGYERSCAKFFPTFINDSATQRILADKPVFLLYLGRITDIQKMIPALQKISDAWKNEYLTSHNLVVVATGFSEAVLAQFAFITANPDQINVFPLVVPEDSPLMNASKNFLDDLAAVTGGTVLDPVSKDLELVQMDPDSGKTDFGNIFVKLNDADQPVWEPQGVAHFECGRYRSSIVGFANEDKLLERLDVVKQQLLASESKLETDIINERVAKLTGGIAKLKVIGSSNGELKERRDRAEDAVCAVRGALKHGALIGGGWMLARMINSLEESDPIEQEIIKLALWMPIITLYQNAGIDVKDIEKDFPFRKNGKLENVMVRDISKNEMVKALEVGILDSLPAVKEALKNSISIATLLGTLGGCVVFPRDKDVDKTEGRDYQDFMRNSNYNPADERA
jgi:chaperonin GroEL